jgi:hypothetical protein
MTTTDANPAATPANAQVQTNGDVATPEAPEKLDEQTKELVELVTSRLDSWTGFYQKQVEELEAKSRSAAEIAGPISDFFGITYQWWNLIALGPFQRVQPLGPFRPQNIIRISDPAFMLIALWRNPAPLPGGVNPSAAQIMSPFTFTIRGETINLSQVINGPDFQPVTAQFGPGFVNVFRMDLPNIPANQRPVEGRPVLYETNFTIDILGVGPGLPPFAGFSTSMFDPNDVPPFVFPFIPGVGPVFVPGRSRGLRHDVPVRYLLYT